MPKISPAQFSRRRFLAAGGAATAGLVLALQPKWAMADDPPPGSENGGQPFNPNTVNYSGYLKSDPVNGGKEFDGLVHFFQPLLSMALPPKAQGASISGYNPLNVTPPPPVEYDVTSVELGIAAMGPWIFGRLTGAPNFAVDKNLMNEATFKLFPAVIVKWTESPVINGVVQPQHKKSFTSVKSLLTDWSHAPTGNTSVDFVPTPPVWVGHPNPLNETRANTSIRVDTITGAVAPPGSSFEVTGNLGAVCTLTGKLTLSSQQLFTGLTIGPVGLSTINVPANVYTTTFQWTFGIAKFNTVTGVWEAIN